MKPVLPIVMVVLSVALARPRDAQAQWTEIGKTSVGNPVSVRTASVARAKDGIVTATVRAVFAMPVKSARGELKASKTVVMVDCAKRTAITIGPDCAGNHQYARCPQNTPHFHHGDASPTVSESVDCLVLLTMNRIHCQLLFDKKQPPRD